MRQIHHWAALLFVAAMIGPPAAGLLHRRVPQAARAQLGHRRRLLLLLGIARGLRRLLAARRPALRHRPAHRRRASCKAIPVVGTYMSFFLFGGEFPGERLIPRLYTVHVLLIPGILLGADRAPTCCCSSTTSTPSARARPHRAATSSATRCFPVYTAKAGGFFFIVFGVTALMGGARSRSTRSGSTGPTTRRRSPPAPSPTGTWAGSTARCGSCPAGRPTSGATRSVVERPDPGPDPARACMFTLLVLLPVHRGLGHRRQARAPPARPPAQRPDPHRARWSR